MAGLIKILTFIRRGNIKCYAILNINAMVNCNSGKDDVMLKARCNVMNDDPSWQLGILCEQRSLIAELLYSVYHLIFLNKRYLQ